MTSDWLQPDQNLKLKTKLEIHIRDITSLLHDSFYISLILTKDFAKLKAFSQPKVSFVLRLTFLLINIPHDRYSKTHSVGLDSWCSCMDVHIIWPGFWYIYNYNHLYWTYIKNINDFPNTMSFMSYLYKPVSEWMHPFNLICENQFVPMSYVWLYCINILMSGNCWGLSIEGYHPPNSPQIQSTISPTPSSNNSLLVSSEVCPPVSLEVCPLAYFEVCLLYQSVFCDLSVDRGLYMLCRMENWNMKSWRCYQK